MYCINSPFTAKLILLAVMHKLYFLAAPDIRFDGFCSSLRVILVREYFGFWFLEKLDFDFRRWRVLLLPVLGLAWSRLDQWVGHMDTNSAFLDSCLISLLVGRIMLNDVKTKENLFFPRYCYAVNNSRFGVWHPWNNFRKLFVLSYLWRLKYFHQQLEYL